ncbi:MAG: hypothetical protein AAGG57_13120 [Pseudomonadota bacterium]
MLQKVKSFLSSECGAVTVDWVVLTAAIVGLVIAAFSGMSDAGVGLADRVAAFMTAFTF